MENSRFKFRVWNNKHNRYIVDSHYPIGSDHIIVIRQDGKAYNLGLGDYEDYSNMHSWAVMEEFTDCIIEQCTGLKDKNGNLIYESDYVKVNDVIYRVFWNKTKISLVNILNGDIIDISETITMEIVGNEHEKDNISEIPKNPKRSSD